MLNRDERVKLVSKIAASFAVADGHHKAEAMYLNYVQNALKLVDDVEKNIPHDGIAEVATSTAPAQSISI